MIRNSPLHPRPPFPTPAAPPGLSSGPILYATAPATHGGGTDPVLDRLLEERIIVVGREVDEEFANRIIAQLLLLAELDPARDIRMYINSVGGSVPAGLAVHDTMRVIGPDIATWAVGLAASTGQFLLSAGAPGKRHALPHARILMHRPSVGGSGGVGDSAVRAGVHEEMKHATAELTARHTGQPVETIAADLDRDRWFTAEQAREYGLLDHVVQP